jgi:hypothetical protein
MVRISYSSTLPLLKLPLLRSDEVNRDLDMFPDQLLPQELPGFVGIMSLLWIRLSDENKGHEINER